MQDTLLFSSHIAPKAYAAANANRQRISAETLECVEWRRRPLCWEVQASKSNATGKVGPKGTRQPSNAAGISLCPVFRNMFLQHLGNLYTWCVTPSKHPATSANKGALMRSSAIWWCRWLEGSCAKLQSLKELNQIARASSPSNLRYLADPSGTWNCSDLLSPCPLLPCSAATGFVVSKFGLWLPAHAGRPMHAAPPTKRCAQLRLQPNVGPIRTTAGW